VEVSVFTTDSGRDRRMPVPLNQQVESEDIKIYYFKTDFSLKYAYSRGLAEACRQHIKNFDLVHVTSFWCYPALAAIPAARHSRVPYLVSTHGTLRKANLQDHLVKKWLYYLAVERRNVTGAAAIHYTTAMERELDAFHRFRTPSFIVPNGFNLEEFDGLMDMLEAKKIWGINPKAQVVTFIGRLHKVKALDLLIKAMSEPPLQAQEVQLLLAGPDGGEEQALRKLAMDLGVEARVRFLGMVSPQDRNNLLAASDILALVSTNENFGITPVEAMLARVPVLLSEHVGISREVLADGAGLVVPLKVEAIAQALGQMLAEPAKLKEMGQRAAIKARERYDINVVGTQMARAYEDILTGRRSPELVWSVN
jgi:glycosyltransferase involved in cell wall biosynthesis